MDFNIWSFALPIIPSLIAGFLNVILGIDDYIEKQLVKYGYEKYKVTSGLTNVGREYFRMVSAYKRVLKLKKEKSKTDLTALRFIVLQLVISYSTALYYVIYFLFLFLN